jgi:hypothetical protein
LQEFLAVFLKINFRAEKNVSLDDEEARLEVHCGFF